MSSVHPAPRPAESRVTDAALVVGPVIAGSIVGIATNANGRGWYRRLSKPGWTPPDGVFGPVWTVLYLLMGVAAALVAREGRASGGQPGALGAFAVQLVLNLGWSVLFFGLRRVRLAFVELCVLWVAILATAVAFARARAVAGAMLLPYLAWTTFAGLLNLEIARRNPGR
jgi:tryptophan-rich sensory protein